jgi:hypothetical protein
MRVYATGFNAFGQLNKRILSSAEGLADEPDDVYHFSLVFDGECPASRRGDCLRSILGELLSTTNGGEYVDEKREKFGQWNA